MSKITFIINPAAGFAKTKKIEKRLIKEIKAQDENAKIMLTHHAMHATSLARDAILAGSERIVAVGGDGTLNEVLNGFFNRSGELLNKNVSLAMVASGTGADFIKVTHQTNSLAEAISFAIKGNAKPCDVGLVEAHSSDGQEIKRHFLNVASFGISGLVAGLMRNMTRKLGGQAAYFMAAIQAIRKFIPPTIIMKDDDGSEHTIDNCSLVAFANGQYFGSGMRIAPYASVDDGFFDRIGVKDLGLWFFIAHGFRVYEGTHIGLDNVLSKRLKECYVTSLEQRPIFVETDGELFAQLPARFRLQAKKLLVVR